MLGEVMKSESAEAEALTLDQGRKPKHWPCWNMDVGSVWVVPPELSNVRMTVHAYTHSNKKYSHLKFQTKTINGVLHVTRIK